MDKRRPVATVSEKIHRAQKLSLSLNLETLRILTGRVGYDFLQCVITCKVQYLCSLRKTNVPPRGPRIAYTSCLKFPVRAFTVTCGSVHLRQYELISSVFLIWRDNRGNRESRIYKKHVPTAFDSKFVRGEVHRLPYIFFRLSQNHPCYQRT